MKAMLSGLIFLVMTWTMAADSRTLVFEGYQVDSKTFQEGETYPPELLVGLTPRWQQSVLLSADSKGVGATSADRLKFNVEVRKVPYEESLYAISAKYEFVSADDGEQPQTTTRLVTTRLRLRKGEARMLAGFKTSVSADKEAGADEKAIVIVAKLAERG